MKDGFIKVACSSIEVVVADVKKNTELIKEKIDFFRIMWSAYCEKWQKLSFF